MSQGTNILFQPLQTLAFGSVGAGFTAIGNPFSSKVRNITLTNLTNQAMIFSYDRGVTAHDVLPAGAGKTYDFAANKSDTDGMSAFQSGGIVYVKYVVAPTGAGAVYVSAFYCLGD